MIEYHLSNKEVIHKKDHAEPVPEHDARFKTCMDITQERT
jgi:hypothetical protein